MQTSFLQLVIILVHQQSPTIQAKRFCEASFDQQMRDSIEKYRAKVQN